MLGGWIGLRNVGGWSLGLWMQFGMGRCLVRWRGNGVYLGCNVVKE